MKGIRVLAVVVGLIVDVAGGALVGVVRVIVAAVIAVTTRGASGAAAAVLSAAHSPVYQALGLLGTTFFVGVGGYVAARMSRPNGVSNAIAVAILDLALSITLFVAMPGVTPIWKAILGAVVTIPAAWIGARLAEPTPTAGAGI